MVGAEEAVGRLVGDAGSDAGGDPGDACEGEPARPFSSAGRDADSAARIGAVRSTRSTGSSAPSEDSSTERPSGVSASPSPCRCTGSADDATGGKSPSPAYTENGANAASCV